VPQPIELSDASVLPTSSFLLLLSFHLFKEELDG